MKIGTSLSKCVVDIVQGKVDILEVMSVVTRTRMEDKRALEMVISQYQHHHWRDTDPEACAAIARQLWDEGLLHQPRLVNESYRYFIPSGNWLNVEPEIHCDAPMVKEAHEAYLALLKLHS